MDLVMPPVSGTNFQSVVQRTVNEKPRFDLGDKVYY
jgi:hypothetical protein